MKFDNYEYHPTKQYVDPHGAPYFEQVEPESLREEEENEISVQWTVYGHIPKGGLDAIADCPDEDTAKFITEALLEQLNRKKQ